MNILVTGAWKVSEDNLSDIKSMGYNVCFMQNEKDDLPCEYEWVECVICNGLFLTHKIEKFVNLKYIQLTSAGFDRVPLDYVKEHKIVINNARGVYSIPMAEFVISSVLCLYKQQKFFFENQKEHKWEKHRGLFELYKKNILIIGCGNVGTECAKRFNAFGTDVYGIDLYPRKDKEYIEITGLKSLKEKISVADVVVLTLPLTKETYHIIDREVLSKLKYNTIIVNIARGAIIDTNELIKVLPKIGGAVLDVFENEPLNNDSALWDFDNVIITPHNSFVGELNSIRLNNIILKGLGEYNENIGHITKK